MSWANFGRRKETEEGYASRGFEGLIVDSKMHRDKLHRLNTVNGRVGLKVESI